MLSNHSADFGRSASNVLSTPHFELLNAYVITFQGVGVKGSGVRVCNALQDVHPNVYCKLLHAHPCLIQHVKLLASLYMCSRWPEQRKCAAAVAELSSAAAAASESPGLRSGFKVADWPALLRMRPYE